MQAVVFDQDIVQLSLNPRVSRARSQLLKRFVQLIPRPVPRCNRQRIAFLSAQIQIEDETCLWRVLASLARRRQVDHLQRQPPVER